jgi:hypothetical protein
VQDENASFIFTYDEPLSHLIYAGADFVRARPRRPPPSSLPLSSPKSKQRELRRSPALAYHRCKERTRATMPQTGI